MDAYWTYLREFVIQFANMSCTFRHVTAVKSSDEIQRLSSVFNLRGSQLHELKINRSESLEKLRSKQQQQERNDNNKSHRWFPRLFDDFKQSCTSRPSSWLILVGWRCIAVGVTAAGWIWLNEKPLGKLVVESRDMREKFNLLHRQTHLEQN